MLIVNPGSRIGAETGEGWTNTYEGAEREARNWLAQMRVDGLRDITLKVPGVPAPDGDGRWVFEFQHHVTGVVVTLETHGISDVDAYCKEHIFSPRIYWNGSSCGTPKVEDWAADGFEVVKTFRRPEVES